MLPLFAYCIRCLGQSLKAKTIKSNKFLSLPNHTGIDGRLLVRNTRLLNENQPTITTICSGNERTGRRSDCEWHLLSSRRLTSSGLRKSYASHIDRSQGPTTKACTQRQIEVIPVYTIKDSCSTACRSWSAHRHEHRHCFRRLQHAPFHHERIRVSLIHQTFSWVIS